MSTRAGYGAFSVVLGMLLLASAGCGGDDKSGGAPSGSGGAGGEGGGASEYVDLDISACDPTSGNFTIDIDNEYFPLVVDSTYVLEGTQEDDSGDTIDVRVETTVLDETEKVAGVTTRTVESQEFEDDELIESVHDYYAQADDGSVCYFGEDVDEIEGGNVVGHNGTWRGGEDGAKPGVIMPGDPMPGTRFKQENAPGIAEDMSAIEALGESISVPAGDFDDALHALDWSPLENETIDDAEDKYYVPSIGLVVDDVAKLTSYHIP